MVMQHIILHTPDGFDLDTHYYPGTNGIGIVFCHGFAWHKEGEEPFVKAAEILNKKGFSTLLFDFRANGKSSGDSTKDFTLSGQQIDITTAVKCLQENGCKTIYLAGASFGGGAATLYATSHQKNIEKLLLANPSLDYKRSAQRHFGPFMDIFEKQGFIETGKRKYKLGKKLFDEMQTFVPFEDLKKWQKDLLIIHGDKDSLIPHQLVVGIFEELTNPHKKLSLIIGSDHGFHQEPFTTQVSEQIVQFFSRP